MPFFLVYWDISGVCNAACRYCPSGSKNILGNIHKSRAGFLSPQDFKSDLVFLTNKGIINPSLTHIGLYSWGEPFLHPDFETMLNIVSSLGFEYSLSTNASTYKEIPHSALDKLVEIKFSMPGFSQESYDRQHGFDFNTIKGNIEKIVAAVRNWTSNVSFSIIYHVYKSNASEALDALAFCHQLKIKFDPLWAIRTGYTMPATMPLLVDSNNFRTDMWEKIVNMQPPNWECPQYGMLVLDEFSNVVQCCATDRYVPNYVIGNIREVDWDKITETRKNAAVCKPCMESGIAFLAHACGGANIEEILKGREIF